MCYSEHGKATGWVAPNRERQSSLLPALPHSKEHATQGGVAMSRKLDTHYCAYCRQPFQTKIPVQRFCSITCGSLSPLSLAERLAQSVQRCGHGDCSLCCWEWTGARHRRGYGSFSHRNQAYRAHVAAWIVHAGQPVARGIQVLHRCDNPPCCNPAHLFTGTQRDNMQDAARKGRLKIPGIFGESHPAAHLSTAQVEYIRALRVQGFSYAAIRKMVQPASHSTIMRICLNQTRKRG